MWLINTSEGSAHSLITAHILYIHTFNILKISKASIHALPDKGFVESYFTSNSRSKQT